MTSAMILNISNIRVKNHTTVMVSDLPSKHELHGQIRNKRNIRDMKRVRRKSAQRRYEQCNGKKKVVKNKDEQNEESYEKKRQNQDTKNKYQEKER
jgi:Mg-chelatase subunit ChlI